MRFKMDKDYISTGSGYYQKVSDGSGPYIKQAKDDYVLAGASGSGSVDVLGTVIEAFSDNTEAPQDGDTLQVALDKLYTFDRAFPTEVKAVSLTGFALKSGKITASDTILSALEKTQQQFDSIPEAFTAAQVRSTALTGMADNDVSPVVATDTLLAAIGKLQAQITYQTTVIADLTARLEALEGA